MFHYVCYGTVTLPAPAYVLCAGYFFVFILSALLLHGLTVVSQHFVISLYFIVLLLT